MSVFQNAQGASDKNITFGQFNLKKIYYIFPIGPKTLL